MDRRTIVVSLRRGFLLCALLLASTAAASAADAPPMVTLPIVTTGKASSNEWPLLIAVDKGFFAAQGLTLDLISAPSTAAAVQQIAGGSVDLAASGGLTDPLRAIDQGAKVSILWIQAPVPPYTLWSKPALKSFADLRGKLIIVGGAKDITRIYLERMLVPNGLKPGQYDLVYAGTTAARFAALSGGAVDAAIMLPPFSFKAEHEGYTMIGRLSDYTKDLPFTGSVVNTEWALAHRELIVRYLTAFKQGVNWFYDDAHRQEAIDIFIKNTGTDRSDAEKTYDYFRQINIFARDGRVTGDSIKTLIKALADDGDLHGSTDPARFLNPEIAKITEAVK